MATESYHGPPVGLLDLESELTCSICTDILYQPLTLLDCLHTFCGSCLKEWFGWQQVRQDQDDSRSHRRHRAYAFTCPSCRTPVRDTRPNATVTTLLEMYIKANPSRAKSEADKEELSKAYKHGDKVLPTNSQESVDDGRRRQRDQRRQQREEEEDAEELEYNRMMENAMALSMDEALSTRAPRRTNRRSQNEAQAADGQYDVRRQHRSDEAVEHSRSVREMHEFDGRPGNSNAVSPLRRNATAARSLRLGHQSSLRSLLSSSEIDSHEMEEEIMRQIQEEGLLDGIDLDNIQVEQEDEISERIAQAYRRRRRARSRQTRERQRGAVHQGDHTRAENAVRQTGSSVSHLTIPSIQATDYARPVIRSGHLSPPEQVSQRLMSSQDASSGRQRCDSSDEPRGASRSATDLTDRPRSRGNEVAGAERASGRRRRSTEPHQIRPSEQWRHAAVDVETAANAATGGSPVSEAVVSDTRIEPTLEVAVDGTLEQARSPSVAAPQVAEELPMTFTCQRCGELHTKHDLHYSCIECAHSQGLDSFDICHRCYLSGRGCLNWYGFGTAALDRYQRQRMTSTSVQPPHYLSPRRYLPSGHIEQGMFCNLCHQVANDCYWRCDCCNDGEWGYCNICIMQARHCIHPLTPYVLDSYRASFATTYDSDGKFLRCLRDLMPYCDICNRPVGKCVDTPSIYVHCPICNQGDYDVCEPCYDKLLSDRRISEIDGWRGWRKCLAGHRMLLIRIGELENPSTRQVISDVVRGWTAELYADHAATVHNEGPSTQWRWRDQLNGSFVVKDNSLSGVHDTAKRSKNDRTGYASSIDTPGQVVLALWTRLPEKGASDELSFPRNAMLTEVVNINDDWSYGLYCRQKGLFPAQYVRETPRG